MTYSKNMMNTKNTAKITLTTGLALFAMFFGAGNMVFPIAIGATAGQHLFYAWLAFMIAGVGLPFMGVFAVSLFEGDYWEFFSILGKYGSFLVVTFIILIIGPIFAAPRTEDITFGTLQPFLPAQVSNHYFSIFYFAIIFIFSYKHLFVVDIIGRFLSPLKLIAFITLIIASLMTAHALLPTAVSAYHVASNALSVGYGTMDLLATFFFCHVAYRSVTHKCSTLGITNKKSLMRIILKACGVGSFLIGFIYTGFMLSAAAHATALKNTPTANIISQLSHVVLGSYGSLFVCLCVTLACIATATALAVVSANFFHYTLFQNKLPRIVCLILVLIIMYSMSILGFNFIMSIAVPILNWLYPALIILCAVNIYRKLR